jgi:predicted transport protein
MSDIKLFQLANNSVTELEGYSVAVEKSLQALIERHLETFLGVRFLASEYVTGRTHGGRIDTLGIDENGCPVIIEYKRSTNENVINQGLFYLDWLLDHKAEFKLLVMEKISKEVADEIEWAGPRLICIAGDFTRYDEHAVQQINRNIELIRYRRYGADLVLLDLVNAVTASNSVSEGSATPPGTATYKTISETLLQLTGELKDRYEAIGAYLQALGDDVQMATLKYYIAFKRIKNFACVEIRLQEKKILVYLKIDPASYALEDGFTRDVTRIGHYGTGDLEVTIRSMADFEKAKPLLLKSYEGS